jgi:hypothetical protein
MDRQGWILVIFAVGLLGVLAPVAATGGVPLDVVWTWTDGGPGRDSGSALARSPTGDLFVVGTAATEDGTDVFLQRRTADGAILWTRHYGGSGPQRGLDVLALDDGGAMVLSSDVDTTGDLDAVLHRIDTDGSVRWSQHYGTGAAEAAYEMVRVGDGYAITGYSASTLGDEMAAWLVRIGPRGDQLWAETYDSGRITAAYDLLSTPDGFVLAGVATNGQPVLQSGDGWLASIRPNGSERWAKRYGGSGGESVRAIVETSTGYALAGLTTSYGDGAASAWLLRTDPQGGELWNRSYGTSRVSVATDIVRTKEGFLLLGSGAPDGDFDIQFRRLSSTGASLELRSIGSSGEESASDLAIVGDTAVATGSTTETTGDSAVYVVGVTAPDPVGTVDWRWPALGLAGSLTVALGATLLLIGWARH